MTNTTLLLNAYALVRRLANVYTVDTDQAVLIRLVAEAKNLVAASIHLHPTCTCGASMVPGRADREAHAESCALRHRM